MNSPAAQRILEKFSVFMTRQEMLDLIDSEIPHWIPCSERLPELAEGGASVDVLAWNSDRAHIAQFDSRGLWFSIERDPDSLDDVTHWMPIEPPPSV